MIPAYSHNIGCRPWIPSGASIPATNAAGSLSESLTTSRRWLYGNLSIKEMSPTDKTASPTLAILRTTTLRSIARIVVRTGDFERNRDFSTSINEAGIISLTNSAELVRFWPPLKPPPEAYPCTNQYVSRFFCWQRSRSCRATNLLTLQPPYDRRP